MMKWEYKLINSKEAEVGCASDWQAAGLVGLAGGFSIAKASVRD